MSLGSSFDRNDFFNSNINAFHIYDLDISLLRDNQELSLIRKYNLPHSRGEETILRYDIKYGEFNNVPHVQEGKLSGLEVWEEISNLIPHSITDEDTLDWFFHYMVDIKLENKIRTKKLIIEAHLEINKLCIDSEMKRAGDFIEIIRELKNKFPNFVVAKKDLNNMLSREDLNNILNPYINRRAEQIHYQNFNIFWNKKYNDINEKKLLIEAEKELLPDDSLILRSGKRIRSNSIEVGLGISVKLLFI